MLVHIVVRLAARPRQTTPEACRKRRAALIPSAATLIVVPSVLLSHWREQLTQHVAWHFVKFVQPAVSERAGNLTREATDGSFDNCVLIDDALFIFSNSTPTLTPLSCTPISVSTTQRQLCHQNLFSEPPFIF